VQTYENGDCIVSVATRLWSGRPPEADFSILFSIQTNYFYSKTK